MFLFLEAPHQSASKSQHPRQLYCPSVTEPLLVSDYSSSSCPPPPTAALRTVNNRKYKETSSTRSNKNKAHHHPFTIEDDDFEAIDKEGHLQPPVAPRHHSRSIQA